jgi:polyisoprenoid-binding protein YceI
MRRTIPVAVAIVAIATAAIVGAYTARFGGDSTPAFTRPSGDGAAVAGGDLIGTWTVAPGSRAGYRAREKLARLPARSDAVGRTDRITGSLVVKRRGDKLVVVSGARFVIDMASLHSPEERRDRRLRTSGLETDTYPTASFTSVYDTPLPADLLAGRAADVLVRGEFNLHGITRTLVLPITAHVGGDVVTLVANLPILMGDFRIHPPNIAGFVTVDIHATMEFKVRLRRT